MIWSAPADEVGTCTIEPLGPPERNETVQNFHTQRFYLTKFLDNVTTQRCSEHRRHAEAVGFIIE